MKKLLLLLSVALLLGVNGLVCVPTKAKPVAKPAAAVPTPAAAAATKKEAAAKEVNVQQPKVEETKISATTFMSRAGDLVDIVPSLVGEGQTLVEGSKTVPDNVKAKLALAKKQQAALKKEKDPEVQNAIIGGIAFNIYDATGEFADFAVSAAGLVKDFGRLSGVFGAGSVQDKAKAFAEKINDPVNEYKLMVDAIKEQLILGGADPEAGLPAADAAKAKADRKAAKGKKPVAKPVAVAAKPAASKMTAGDYAKAALKMVKVLGTLVSQSKRFIEGGSTLPADMKAKLARLKIKQHNLTKAKTDGDEAREKVIALSMNLDLFDIALLLGVFCANGAETITSFGDFADLVQQKIVATKAKMIGLKLKVQANDLIAIVKQVRAQMVANGADPEAGMEAPEPVAVAAEPAAEEPAVEAEPAPEEEPAVEPEEE